MMQDSYSNELLILLLTDQLATATAIADPLKPLYQVLQVSTEAAALEKAIAFSPALVLVDEATSTPVEGWWVQTMRSQPGLEHTPVIVLTAGASADVRAAWLHQGVQDYVVCPVSATELQTRIENQLALKQVRAIVQGQSVQPSILDGDKQLDTQQRLYAALTAMQSGEFQFRRLAESNIIGIITWDVYGNILDANDMVLKILGYTRKEVQTGQLRWTDITPPEQTEQDEISLMELRQNGICIPLEKEYIHKNGRRISVLIGGVFLDDSQERGVSFVLDITDRKQAEADLQTAYNELDGRVQQRTAELSQTNIQLQAEITERFKSEAALRASRESIRVLYEVVADPFLDFSGKVQALLALGCQHFHLNIGVLGQVVRQGTGPLGHSGFEVKEICFSNALMELGGPGVAIAKGDVFPLDHTYCQVTLQSKEPVSFEQASATEQWCSHACYQATKLETYIGAPIIVAGQVYGTLSFTSPTPRSTPFTSQEKKFLQLMAQWVGSEIARQQTEEALRQSEERYRLMADHSSDLISRHSLDGVYLYASPACRTLLGYEPEELVGRSIYDFFHADDAAAFKRTQKAVIHLPHTYTLTYRARRRDGFYVWLEMTSQLVQDPDSRGETQLLIVSRDIDARKQAEIDICTLNAELEQRVAERTAELEAANRLKDELLQRAQEARTQAEIASRMKDEFLATLSHELRTPLNSILGWAQLLRTRTFDEATTHQALETIERNARSQSQLVGDILDVSRIIRGKIRLNVCPINLRSLVEVAIDSVRPAAEAKNIYIESHAQADVGQLAGDPERLQQIMWNLLSNAIKFTPQGGRVEVNLERHETTIDLIVKDTGEGISLEFLPYVFDRFRQADGTINRPYGGLGLGLAIVRHLVELHGGTVRADSLGIGQGATFTVSLPVSHEGVKLNAPVGQAVEETSAVSSGSNLVSKAGQQRHDLPDRQELSPSPLQLSILSGLHVLVVDDEGDTRQFLSMLLDRHGAIATTVGSVPEAVELLMNATIDQLPDVLVSDVGMPGQDGYDLIRQVKAIARNRHFTLPAVALTAYAGANDREQLLRAGFHLHIPKPVEPGELVTAVASLAKRL
jgi:PAS domain S-box-containing protein